MNDPPDHASPDRSHGGAVEWLVDEPMLHEPVLVVMLTGWIDASGAAGAAAAAVAAAVEAGPILRFDDDTFIDHRARRPVMELRNGINTNLVWAITELRAGRTAEGRDVLLLTGPEPDMSWHRFCRIVAELADELGVVQMVAFGAYPFAAPHTRPSRLAASSPSTEVLARVPYSRSSVDVPAGVAAALEHALHSRKIPTLGLWAQVPHYVSGGEYPAASVALLDGLGEVAGIHVPAAALRAGVDSTRARIDAMVAENPDHRSMVAQLEELYDAVVADERAASAASHPSAGTGDEPADGELQLRSGDELADEIQRFLRDQD